MNVKKQLSFLLFSVPSTGKALPLESFKLSLQMGNRLRVQHGNTLMKRFLI